MAYLKKREVWTWLSMLKPGTYTLPDAVLQQFPYTGKNPGRYKARIQRICDEWEGRTSAEPPMEQYDPEPPITQGTMEDPAERRIGPRTGKQTYVFTCAQNNTDLIPEHWWKALMNLVDHYEAELHVSRFTYNKASYGKNSVKPGTTKLTDTRDLFYAPEIEPYISDEDIQITDDLVWLGSVSLQPTAVNPIAGWQNHTRHASCILPHTKLAMESVPTMKSDPAKFIFTTGSVTQRNYIQKGAGQKADFHHVFGALLVEVDENGDWWARQLNFDKNGTLYDLTNRFTAEGVTSCTVEAITHGDIHGYKMDTAVCDTVFRDGGMLDTLHPQHQFFHDIIDFMPRNHHNRRDFQFVNDMRRDGTERVLDEFRFVSDWFMRHCVRNWCRSHIVVSNHDQAIDTWLADRSNLDDPANVRDWLQLNHERAVYGPGYHAFARSMDRFMHGARMSLRGHRYATLSLPRIIKEDQSFKILGQIEAGLHGHLGPNGARGTPRNLRTAGKANTGHTHSAGIVEGVYTAGVLGKLDMGYNRGLSSWSHSSIITYANGKRTIVTHRAGKWWR